MISLFAALLAIPNHKVSGKRESPIEPFIRTAQLAEDERTKAIEKLERATINLTKVIAEKFSNGI